MAEDCSSGVNATPRHFTRTVPEHGWPVKNLAGKTPGEMVRAGAKAQSSHHYFCELDVVVVLEVPQRRFLQECPWRII